MPRDGLRNDYGELPAQLINLCLQIRIPQIATSKLCARRRKFAEQHADLLACLRESSLADARGHIPFLLAKLDGVNTEVGVPAQLL